MRFSNDGVNWTNWELFAPEYPWNLGDWRYGGQYGLTVYTVYAQFRDYQDNESQVYSDSITKVAGTPGQIILKGQFYETIQDAVDAASAGDVVYLTEGVYELPGDIVPTNYSNRSAGIQMKPGVTLRGAGPDKTIVDVRGYAFAGIIDADNSVIEGLTIINSGSLSWRYVVLLESSLSSIRNCIVKGGATGIQIGFGQSALNSEIAYNVIEGNSYSGIWLSSGSSISIYNNTIINNNPSGGYGFFGYLGSAFMANNIITKSIVGIFSYNTPSNFLNNNVYVDVSGGSPANYSGIPDQTGIIILQGPSDAMNIFFSETGHPFSTGSKVQK
jgi:hypothetical protein